tara:strand:- start:14908 stop:15108 length:201 start_codon:yes stop_codon:yes gene_type:complete
MALTRKEKKAKKPKIGDLVKITNKSFKNHYGIIVDVVKTGGKTWFKVYGSRDLKFAHLWISDFKKI